MNKEIKIDLGNTKGVARTLDDLGRIVFPKEFRKELNLNAEDKVEVYLLEEGIYITPKRK